MKVLVVTGGDNSEREISLLSAKEVKAGLERNNFTVELFDLKEGLGNLERSILKYDVIFPVLHGEEGEGGELQRFLTTKSIKFVGGDWRGFKKGWYKESFKRWATSRGLPTPPWQAVKTREDIIEFGFPSVLKNDNGGSSKEVVIIESERDLKTAEVERLLKSGDKLYVEKFIKGVEITVGMLDDQVLPVIEIVPPDDSWFDYQNKYSGRTQEIVGAPSLSESARIRSQEVTSLIHRELNLGQYSRTDLIVDGENIYILEVNTIPGMTAESLYPKAAKAIGLDFPSLVKHLVNGAKRY